MNPNEHIIATLKTLLAYLNVAYKEIRTETDEKTGSARVVIATPDSAILIGERGARLMALNHLMKRMLEKALENGAPSFTIDVNDYQKKRIDDIRAKAQMLAERARYFKSSVEMDPMSSYERMIVHAEFADTPDIETASSGQGKDRHVVIRYTEEKRVSAA